MQKQVEETRSESNYAPGGKGRKTSEVPAGKPTTVDRHAETSLRQAEAKIHACDLFSGKLLTDCQQRLKKLAGGGLEPPTSGL